MKTFERISRGVAITAGVVGALAIAALMINVVADVVSRTAFNKPVPATLEYVQYWWMPLIAFATWGFTQLSKEHIEAPLLYDRVTASAQRVWYLIGDALLLVAVGLIAYYSWPVAVDAQSMGEFAGANNTPIWPARFLPIVGAVLLAPLLIAHMVHVLRRWNTPELAVDDSDMGMGADAVTAGTDDDPPPPTLASTAAAADGPPALSADDAKESSR